MRTITNDDVIAFIGALAIFSAAAFWRGYVLSKMWGWYVVPIFALKPLGLVAAVGILFITSLFTKATPWVSNRRLIEHSTVAPLAVLALGWLLKPFIVVAA